MSAGIQQSCLTLIDESRKYEASGEIGLAAQCADQALSLARFPENNQFLGAALAQSASIHFRLGHYSLARQQAEESLLACEPISPNRAEACLVLGNVAAETNFLSDAENWYHQAADIARSTGYDLMRMRSQANLATGVYFPRGQFSLALTATLDACKIARQANLDRSIGYPLTTLTWIYQIIGHTFQAHEALDELKSICLPGSLHQGYAYFLEGELAIDEGRANAAPMLFIQARSIAEAIGEPGLNVQARLGLSQCCQESGNLAEAEQWANEAVILAERATYSHMLGISLVQFARITWMAGNLEKASILLDKAIFTLNQISARYDLTRAYLLKAAILCQDPQSNNGEEAWVNAVNLVRGGDFDFLVKRERSMIYNLIGALSNRRNNELKKTTQEMADRLDKIPAEPLQVTLLGAFQISQGTRIISARELFQRRAGELLGLLLVTPERHLTAEQVCETLWTENDPEAARRMLHHTTSALRQILEPDLPARYHSHYLEIEEGQIYLTLPKGSWVDLESFENCIDQKEWEAALSVYGGELFPMYPYSEWANSPRQRVHFQVQQALLAVAEVRLSQDRFREALDLSRRLLALEPWEERAVWIAMKAYQALGDPTGAMRTYQALETTLLKELGTVPTLELRNLARQLFDRT